MDKSFDKIFTDRVQDLMEKNKISNNLLALILDISLKSTNDLLQCKSPWRLKYIIKVSEYFGVTTDFLIFGDDKYIEKLSYKRKIEIKEDIKNFLVSENKFFVYGKLNSSGFFDDLENKNKKS